MIIGIPYYVVNDGENEKTNLYRRKSHDEEFVRLPSFSLLNRILLIGEEGRILSIYYSIFYNMANL